MDSLKLIDTQDISLEDNKSYLDALNRVQALIEFKVDGTILAANNNLLNLLGYSLDEVVGKHHRILCNSEDVATLDYKYLWEKVGRGESQEGESRRVSRSGKEFWVSSIMTPVIDANGKVQKIIELIIDNSQTKARIAEFEGKSNAINRVQAVIEFQLDGTIISANQNFLDTLGYRLDEITGKHHSIFCEAGFDQTPAYKEFWQRLGRGEFVKGEYKRIGKGGKEVWINASYNPIVDLQGRVSKVVKYATDISLSKLFSAEQDSKLAALGKSQAIIEFNLDGTIITANENFLESLGYTLSEIQGRHHRIFCDNKYIQTNEYMNFWDKLSRGIFDQGEYKRIGKDGREVWINASYNPIFDMNGKCFKVVKYATVTTDMKLRNAEYEGKV
ncbi:MAG: PAS domain S-box protein, partial [Proteobacteria bacterium]